jgi:transposase-like protein
MTFGGLFSLFAGQKCPGCSSRNSQRLGSRDKGQRIIGGRWHDVWLTFYICKNCGSTWLYSEGCEAQYNKGHLMAKAKPVSVKSSFKKVRTRSGVKTVYQKAHSRSRAKKK